MRLSRFVSRGRFFGSKVTGLSLALVIAAFGAVDAAAQNTGTVTGLVRDAATLQPLAGAQVSVEGTGVGGLANNVGRFLLLNVPAGEQTVAVTLIGYTPSTQTVTVTAGGSVVVDFSLREQALALEGVVVTGTAGQARRREIGNQVSQLGSADIELTAVTDVADILQGRASGVQVNSFGGQVGASSQIRLRGNSSLTQSNNPLIYVDGVRMENNNVTGDDEQAAASSAFDMINPNDIERIEIVKGPAATTLYGTEAAGGVIQIFTKRGTAGAPAWSLNVEQGVNSMPLQAGGLNPEEINPTGYYLNDCTILREYDSGTRSFIDVPVPTDPETGRYTNGCPSNGSWFQNGYVQKYNLSVRGGSEAVTYFVSGRFDDESGVVDPQGARSYGVRANVSFQPMDGLDITLNNSYQNRDITWIPDGNNASGFMLNVLRGTADYTGNDDSLLFENDLLSQIQQFQTGLTVLWAPTSMWSHRLNVGLDYTVNNFTDWKFWGYFRGAERNGDREYDNDEDRNLTFDYVGTLNYDFGENIASNLSFGGQLYEEFSYGVNGFDAEFAGPGEPLLGDGTVPQVFENRLRIRSGGFFVQEQVGFQDRIFLTAGVRWDGFSTFGEGFGLATYPKLSASWLLSDYDFWPTDLVDTFKFRSAWGRSGRAPGAFDAEKLWSATSADELQPAVVINNFGNPDLGPEQSEEIEVGFDASAFDGRVTTEFTYYKQTTSDALIGLPPIPSTGTNNSIQRNLGELQNWGTEFSLDVVALRTDDVEWSVGGSWSTNDSEVTDLGDLPELNSTIQLGLPHRIRWDDQLRVCGRAPRPDSPQEDIPGSATGPTCWDPDAAYDPNNIPRLGKRFIGRQFPTDIVALNTRVSLFNQLTIDILGEGQYGHFLPIGPAYQNMRRTSLTNPVWPYCAPILDTWLNGDRTSLTNQQVVECIQARSDQGVWTREADFFRLRSATIAWRLPDEWVPGGRSATVQFQGRNLFRITDYAGIDPEGLDNGSGDSTPNDYYTYGPPRTFMFGLTVNF